MKKIPEVLRLKEKIDALNGAEFDSKILKDFKDGNTSLATLKRRGYVKLVRQHEPDIGRPYNIYQVTGNAYVSSSPRKSSYSKPVKEEVLIFGKYLLSEIPQQAVTVHRLGI